MLNPDRVELVRLRLGLTKTGFAAALDVDRKTLHRFESGKELSPDLADRLVTVSGYPIEFFEKPAVEYPNPHGVSFRSLRALTSSARDSALAAGALAFELDDWVADRFNFPAPALPIVNNKLPEESAAAVRSYWGIGVRPIGNMINLLESHGVRVFSLVEETRHLDAYSFWRNETPYAFLNTVKTGEHGRFDAAHELGHLVMHRHTGATHRGAEDEANAFASAFLMPRADLLAQMPRVRNFDDLVRGKKRWRVSVAALNYALHRIGVISDWHYRGYYIELAKYGRANEPEPIEAETSQVWEKILTSLWKDGISLSHVAQQLAVPERELSNLLFGIASRIGRPKEFGKPRLVQ